MSKTKEYNDGSVYIGNFNEAGEKNGIGTLTFKDKTKYHGHFENGLFAGHGVLEVPADSGSVHRYQGQFERGKFSGYGVFTQGDSMKYEGQFQDGMIHGTGRLTFKDNTNGVPHYEGCFKNGEITERKLCSREVELAREASIKASKL